MNVWKKRLLILLGAVCLSISSVQAESFKEDMSSALPKEFSYTDIAGDYSIQFLGQSMEYHMGQVSFVDPKTENFSSGYLIAGTLPSQVSAYLLPYFKLNLSSSEWTGLLYMNKQILNEDSPLMSEIRKTMGSWAERVIGTEGRANLKIHFTEMEPLRKVTLQSLLYTAGGKIIFDSDGLIYPMYSRMYFMRNGNDIDMLMLLTPDEGKQPLVFAIDDAAKAMYTKRLGSL